MTNYLQLFLFGTLIFLYYLCSDYYEHDTTQCKYQ